MVNYLGILYHSDIVRPLQNLIPEYKNLTLSDRRSQISFLQSKYDYDCPTMYFLENNADIYICTDASDYGIGDTVTKLSRTKRPVGW
jgi:hypothetical protein